MTRRKRNKKLTIFGGIIGNQKPIVFIPVNIQHFAASTALWVL